MSDLAANTHTILTSYGFRLNYKPGKSAFTLNIRGQGTIAAKQRLHEDNSHTIFCPEWDLNIPITHIYDYLGTHLDPTCSTTVRAIHQITKQKAAMAPLRPTHLRNQQLRTAIKVQLVDMFANCHLYYQAETWEPLTTSTTQALDSARNQAYRTATRRHYLTNNNQGTNDDDMHILTNTTDYTTMLRPKRLHYLVSLLQHGPAILLRTLDAHHAQTIDQQESDTASWLSLITSDVAWMAKITTKANSTQREWALQRWIEHADDSPKTFRHQNQPGTT